MTNRRLPTTFTLLMLACVAAALAPARPLDTDDTGTAEKGVWEIEGGIDFLKTADGDSAAFTPVAAYGLTDSLQLDIGCDYLLEMGVEGERDVHSLRPSLQVKSILTEWEASGVSLGVKANFGRHVHVRGPRGEVENSGHVRVLLTKEVGNTEFDFNAGYDFTDSWGDGDDAWIAAVGARRAVTESFSLVGEIFCTVPERGGETTAIVAVGVQRAARGSWTFDALIGTGLGRGGPEFRAVLGFIHTL